MKEFNLEAAKAGAPVCTRDGRKARIICWDRKSPAYPILALVTDADGFEDCISYTNNGRCLSSDVNSDDLMMVTTKHEGWVNIYPNPNLPIENVIADGGYIFSSEEKARACTRAGQSRIATVKIEWED